MAYTSFRLRKDNVSAGNGGSALRRTAYEQDATNPSGSGSAAFDSGLKAENFVAPVPASYLESVFAADMFIRNQVELSWRLEVPLVATPTSASFEPTKIVIRASNDGEPSTVSDGVAVTEVTNDPYFEAYQDTNKPYITPGTWVYYSMFVLYGSNSGDQYYERVATLSIIVPIDFGSVDAMWRHIPTYYRELDETYATSTERYTTPSEFPELFGRGPLYRFVNVLGWEIDKLRTIIYNTMRINDPEVIHSSAIDALADQMGIEFNKTVLGTAKLRAVLNNIGYLQRTKGTLPSVESYISALSGCGVEVNTAVSPIEFNIHPHRVNLFSDPFFFNNPTFTDNGDPIYRRWTDLNEAGRWYGWGAFVHYSDTPAVAPTFSNSGEKLSITLPPVSGGTATVIVYSRGVFDYDNTLPYYGSAVSSHPFALRFVSQMSVMTWLELATLVSETYYFLDTWNDSTPISEFPTFSHPTRTVVGNIPSPTAMSPTSAVPAFVFEIDLPSSGDTSFSFSNPLVEYRHSHGDFFSGNEVFGGFIPDATGATPGTYDYHWGPNGASSPHTDFSYYTLDYYRVKEVTANIIKNYVVPVTLEYLTDYEINWDVLE